MLFTASQHNNHWYKLIKSIVSELCVTELITILKTTSQTNRAWIPTSRKLPTC